MHDVYRKAMLWIFKKLDWWLILAVFFLIFLGLIMIVSLSLKDPNPLSWFLRQLGWIAIGVLAFLLFSALDYRMFRTSFAITFGFYLVAIAMLISVLYFGTVIHGSRAWFKIGSFTLQPVEFAKIALLLILAKYFAEHNIEIWQFWHVLISAILLFLPLGLVLLQPDWGSGITLILLWFSLVLFSGARARQIAFLIFIFLILGIFSWNALLSYSQKSRVTSLLFPDVDPTGATYNQRQALIAIGSGGFWGQGLGKGPQSQLRFLPASRTDFIFASIAEELGFTGVALLLLAYGLLFYRIAKISLLANNNFARLFLLGFLILLATQIFINLGMNLGILPVIGIGLPFVSYGGSSLISLFMALGIASSIKARI
ncbi:MAG: FtsW/RodA/SpoVE family cell cycle protein [Candidatus Paceibacteria bacterium]